MQAWLDNAGLKYDLTDKVIPDGRASECGVYNRPDFLFDCGTHFVVLEVDENAHAGYTCELARMVNITSTLGMSTVFVRYNPDGYKPARGHRAVGDAKRKEVLITVLQHNMNSLNVTAEDVERSTTGCWMVQLFFDGDDPCKHGELVGIHHRTD